MLEVRAGGDHGGVLRKPGQSRQDVLSTNLPILDSIMVDTAHHAPTATVLVVSNPVDVLTYRAWRERARARQGVRAGGKCWIPRA